MEDLARIPRLCATDDVSAAEKLIYEHFFIFSCDWYMAEYDPKNRLFFGYAILNADYQNSEWGYIDFDELRSLKIAGYEVDRDLYWQPKKASLVDKIVRGGGV